MGRLNQRHILVAISGGIAAYKGAELVRLLKKQGALVRVVLSRGATEFITPSPCRPCQESPRIPSSSTRRRRRVWGILNWRAGQT